MFKYINLDMFFGFSDELQKIAEVAFEASSSSRATGSSQVTKPVSTASSTKPKLPKLVAKPQPATDFAPSQDHLRSMKANPSPPVMM